MRKLIAPLAVALVFAVGMALASETPRKNTQPGESDKTAVCEQLKLRGANPKQLAQQSCCSSQGGVCGCQYGAIVCCNGQSSNCGC